MKQSFETLKDAESYANGLLKEAAIRGKALKEEAKRQGEAVILAAKSNKTEKDPKDKAKKVAKSLLKEAEEEEKKLKEEAKQKGTAAIKEAKEKKEHAKARDKGLDKQIQSLINVADQHKTKGEPSALLPRIYLAINVAAKVADRGLSHIVRNPADAIRVAKLGLDIKEHLEKELGTSLKKADKNVILQSELVANLLSDPGLWQVVSLQSDKMPRILAKFREEIGKEIQDIIETPGTITTKSKLHLAKQILSNPEALKALIQVAYQNQESFARFLTSSQTTKGLLVKYGVDASNIEKFVPSLILMLGTLPENRETILEMIKIAEPVILGKSKDLDVKALIPHVANLVGSGVTLQAAELLTANHEDLLTLASNPALQAPLAKMGLEQGKVLEVASAFLPVVAQVLSNQEVLVPLVAKSPSVIGDPMDVKAAMGLIPEARELLIGENGVLGSAVQAIAAQRDNLALMAASAVGQNPAIQAGLKKAFNTDKPVAVPAPLIAGALDVAVAVLDESNHEQLGRVLDEVQKVKVVDNKPVLSNVQIVEIARQVAPLLTNEKTVESLGALLTPENVQFLSSVPALKAYVTPQSQELIIDAGKRLLASTEPVQTFLTNHYGIVEKVLRGRDNLENGVFEDTDLNPQEVVTVAKTALQVVQKVNPQEFLIKHKETITQLVAPVISTQLGQKDAKQSKRLASELTPILIDAGAMLLEPKKLKEIEELAENLAPILDEKTPIKARLEKVSQVADFFAKQIKSPEFKELYGKQVIPFLSKNKEAVGQLLTDLPKRVPALRKLNIKGDEIVNILADQKTLDKLESAYDAYKDGSYIKALGKVVTAAYGSKDLRSVISAAALDVARESLYPNFMRRMLVGSRVNSFINDCKLENLKDSHEKLNLAEKFSEKAEEGTGIFSYTLRSQVCKGLDFSSLEFTNMAIDGFDFREASFGSKAKTTFKDSNFKNVNFQDCILRGKTIDLSNATFDLASFQTILPQLDKAIKEGKTIKTEGMKISITTAQDLQELQTIKEKSKFGKSILDPTSKTRVKLVKDANENTEIPFSPPKHRATLHQKRAEVLPPQIDSRA